MKAITVGLIPSPDMPNKLIDKVINQLEETFKSNIDSNVDWHFEQEVTPMIGTSEHMDETLDLIKDKKNQNNWDYVICVTDLPSISGKKAVVCDINTDTHSAFLSLPALGVINLKKKLKSFLAFVLNYMYRKEDDVDLLKNKGFKFAKISKVTPNEDNSTQTVRIIIESAAIGWIHIIAGMTYANEPWSAIGDFKKIISVSFATGTYVSIFSTPWDLSISYDYWRFILLTLLSLIGMTAWLIYSYKLWEHPSTKTQRIYRNAYNLTTFMTVGSITIFHYLLLFVLLGISALLFVPPELFTSWTSLNSIHPTFIDYVNLIWFITSLGFLAGALGSTVENAEKIRRVTYSYRQYYRYEYISQSQSEDDKENEEQYEGEKQSHRKEEK